MDREQIRPLGRAALDPVEPVGEHEAWSLAERAIGGAVATTHDALADIEETTRELTHRIEAARAKGRMDAGDR